MNRFALASMLFLSLSLSVFAQSTPSTQPTPSTAPTTQETLATSEVKLRLFTPAWRYIGPQKPQDVAKNFTFIFGGMDPKGFHEGNPESKCIRYLLGPYVDPGTMKAAGEEVMAKDDKGQTIKAAGFPNWLILPDHPKWLEFVKSEVETKVNQTAFDGAFSDSMGLAPIVSSYVSGKPINPATGKHYTAKEWLEAECKMLQTVNDALDEGRLHILNGLTKGDRYWTEPEEESPRVMLDYVDGAMSETIWRYPNSPLDEWPSAELWMKEIRMIQDVEKRGKIGFWWTKCWTGQGFDSTTQPNADTLIPQWRRFVLGSYLLAAGAHSYFNFDTKRVDYPDRKGDQISNAAEWFVEYEAAEPLGTATGEMAQIGETGAYYRTFTGGLVIVNPTDKSIDNAEVPGEAYNSKSLKSWGEDRSITFPTTIKPHTGLILTFE